MEVDGEEGGNRENKGAQDTNDVIEKMGKGWVSGSVGKDVGEQERERALKEFSEYQPLKRKTTFDVVMVKCA